MIFFGRIPDGDFHFTGDADLTQGTKKAYANGSES